MIGEVRDDARLTADEIANRVPGSRYEHTNYPTSTEVIDDSRNDPRIGSREVVRDVDVDREVAAQRLQVVDERVADQRVGDERAAADQRPVEQRMDSGLGNDQPGPLFPSNELNDLRARWDKAQIGFVDEPRTAVKQADELVATVVKRISEQFATERSELEHQWDRGDNVSTEDLRQALRRYRSFFDRLLAF
ncbi:hypothetical protein [Tunturiibacter gelidoferens]|uniref:Uncharacterized protein n=2 Tax=Tunturiibacter TaxID=3154218 RepID=A0A7Y9T2W5_9BACT|nr:hypothetical protein [Edaphobacter lichenicola]NYF49784.1 hypothetical protein [Edaphobacter lichenicola]